MSRRVRLARSAIGDLDDIWDYIAIENHSQVAADNLIDEFDGHFNLLLTWPLIGEAVDHLRLGTRRTVVRKRFLAFYEPS